MLGLVPVDESILRRANRIISRCHPRVVLRSLDAIHLASCEAADAFPLLTPDRQRRAAADHLRFPLGPSPAVSSRYKILAMILNLQDTPPMEENA